MAYLREWIGRFWGSISGVRTDADLEEELRAHLALAAEHGRTSGAGTVPHAMDALRDQRGLPWLDAIASDITFGIRQLKKHRAVSLAAILSLGVSIGATTAAFRLVDAVLLRPLPVAEPDRLFALATTFIDADKRVDYTDYFDYPTYRTYSALVADMADVMVVGFAARHSILLGNTPEVITSQYLSGNAFGSLGLQPVVGRLFTPADDRTPGAHPVAVATHDFWTRRFGRDPAIVGTTFRSGGQQVEIIGVAPENFTGTEPGSVTDLFMPAMMNAKAIDSPGWAWFRIWLRPKNGVAAEQVRQVLDARFRSDRHARINSLPADTPKERIDDFMREQVVLLAAGSGVSQTQRTFRRPLLIMTALAALVLLIACTNVANLLVAQAMARTREMALRVSIGAGRGRLVQLVLVESALLALCASIIGALFASWSAPFIVSMLGQAERPVKLVLEPDWRAFGFGIALAVVVTGLFGLAPALRASAVKPLRALKGSDDADAPRRFTYPLIAAQTGFCVFLVFAAGLFVTTFERLANRPLGFSHEKLLLVRIDSRTSTAHAPALWAQLAERLRELPGIEAVAMAGWAPLTGNRWTSTVRVSGQPVPARSPYLLDILPGYFSALGIDLVRGRDFRSSDTRPGTSEEGRPMAGVGIVNDAFARAYFDGQDPVGRTVTLHEAPMEIVGLVRDAAYFSVREPMHPTVYLPIEARDSGTFMIRTSIEPPALTTMVRSVLSGRDDLRSRAVEPLTPFITQQMLRERLLAALSAFFAGVALLLAAVGLYGVLNFTVVRRRREIGIRMALGARTVHVVGRITRPLLGIVCVGCIAGLTGGFVFGRAVRALLFEVQVTDLPASIVPILTLGLAGTLAAMPAAIRAARIDPIQTLRSE